jgi:hypothetical protein
MTNYAPSAEQYVPTKTFQYAPSQKEDDFAQLVAAQVPHTEALYRSRLITKDEYDKSSRSALYALAARLLSTPAVQERLDHYTELQKASLSIYRERILQERAAVAFADFALLYDPDTGRPITNPHQLPRYIRAALKEWGFDKDGVLKAKMHDKNISLKALEEMGGLYDEANRAKAPQVTVNLSSSHSLVQSAPAAHCTIDITPSPSSSIQSPLD